MSARTVTDAVDDTDIPEDFQRELSNIARGDGDADSYGVLFRALLAHGWTPPSR